MNYSCVSSYSSLSFFLVQTLHVWKNMLCSYLKFRDFFHCICIGPCFCNFVCVMYTYQFTNGFKSCFSILILSDKSLSLVVCYCACTFSAYNNWAYKKWRMVSEELCSCQSSWVWRCKPWWCKCCFWRCWGMLCP